MRFIDRLRRRLRDQCGMTMIELMVAAAVCSIGIAATIGVMDGSRSAAVKSEKRDVMAHQGERELEKYMELPWANFSHPSTPTSSPYSGTPTGTAFAYDRTNTALSENLVVNSLNGQVPSTASSWNDNQSRLSGKVYRFVTSVNANARRLTVVVTVDGANPTTPVLLSSIKVDPILN